MKRSMSTETCNAPEPIGQGVSRILKGSSPRQEEYEVLEAEGVFRRMEPMAVPHFAGGTSRTKIGPLNLARRGHPYG